MDTQAVTPDSSDLDRPNGPTVFVIEVLGSPAFAFEAISCSDAVRIAGSRWFQRAIDELLSKLHETSAPKMALRPATDVEASLFRETADEFSESANDLFVAHLPDWRVIGL